MSPRCASLALKHYLLKPVQRIPQYRLLLTGGLLQQVPNQLFTALVKLLSPKFALYFILVTPLSKMQVLDCHRHLTYSLPELKCLESCIHPCEHSHLLTFVCTLLFA